MEINDFNYAHYIYRITNNTNKKYYIGIHSTKIIYDFKNEDELRNFLVSDGYWGSGTEITKAIRKEGLKNFTKEVLGIFNTREETLQEESRLVTLDVIRDPQSYNLSLGGFGTLTIGTHISVVDISTGKHLYIEKSIFESNKNNFKVISSTYGKKWITNGVENKLIDKSENLPVGWNFGKVELNKIRSSQKNYIYKNIITGEKIKKPISYKNWEKIFTVDCLDYPMLFFLPSGKFLSYEYIKELYNECPSWIRISEKLSISYYRIKFIVKLYKSIGKVFNSDKKSEIRKPPLTRWIIGKTYITNIKNGKCLIINASELSKYLSNEDWVSGKIRRNLLENRQNILNDYISLDRGSRLEIIARKYTTTISKIKILLNLNTNNSKVYWLKNNNNELIHGLYNDEMIELLSKSGWEIVNNKKHTVSKTL